MAAQPKTVEPLDLKTRLDAGEKLLVLDVREPQEVAICRIPGAVHIPMNEVPTRLRELDRTLPVVVYCHHGMRSQRVGMFLLQEGFADVSNLRGGIEHWAAFIDPAMARY